MKCFFGTFTLFLLMLWIAIPVNAQEPVCEDLIYAEVIEGDVHLFHEGAVYNCCPDHFAYTVDVTGSEVLVTEFEIEGEPCDCVCCFDLKVVILDLAPGAYEVTFRWYDYGAWVWQEWLLEVTVPDLGQPDDPAVGDVLKSECYWDTTGVGEPEVRLDSWGMIKALYR